MRASTAALLLLTLPGSLRAQKSTTISESPPQLATVAYQRIVTVTPGFGNAMGVLGIQGERYFSGDRLSAFAGLGYSPELDAGDPRGVAVAAGLRGYTPGLRHRGFLELSVAEVGLETGSTPGQRYGPSLQAGYQYTALSGFTAMISVGAGYALGVSDQAVGSRTQLTTGLGIGYTWRR